MKKVLCFILLLLSSTPVFADGHSMDGLIYVVLFAVTMAFIPLLVLTLSSINNFKRPRKNLFIFCSIILFTCLIFYTCGFYYYADNISYKRAGPFYILCLFICATLLIIDIILLLLAYRKWKNAQLKIQKSWNSNTDILIIIGLGYWLLASICNFIIQEKIEKWYLPPTKYLMIGIDLINSFVPILFAISIKSKRLKPIALITSIILCAIFIYKNLSWLFEDL